MYLFCCGWICCLATLPTVVSTSISPDALFAGQSLTAKQFQATYETKLSPDAKFKKTLVICHAGKPDNIWQVQYCVSLKTPIRKGDVLFFECDARAISSKAMLTINFQQRIRPWAKDISREMALSGQWTKIQIGFVARRDATAKSAGLFLMTGYAPQTIELANVRLVNFGPKADVKSLPRTAITYAGREKTAAWRTVAAKQIEQHRKAGLTIQVTDAAGKPLPGASVRVEQTSHAYRFGSAISARAIVAKTPQAKRYRELALELFNTVTIENAMKWKQWPAEKRWAKQGWANLAATLTWCKENNLRLRGHCLIWPGWNYLPPSLAKLKSNPARLRELIATRIAEAMAKTRGIADEWDVVNEPFANHDLQTILGKNAIAEWFRLARKADPACRLFLNEYHILSAGGRTNTPHQAHFEKTARDLLAAKAPLDALGMQCHFNAPLTPPKTLWQILDRYAKLGLPIEITELDVTVNDRQLQADYLRDFMTAIFAHRATTGIVMWGFWAGRQWNPQAALYDTDFTPRPAAKVWKNLIFKQWWTRATAKTNTAGEATIRAFKGTHTIIVTTPDGKTVTQAVELTAEKTITVTVK